MSLRLAYFRQIILFIIIISLSSFISLAYSGNIYGKVLSKSGDVLYNQKVELYFLDSNNTIINYNTTTYTKSFAQQSGNPNLEGYFFFDNEKLNSGSRFLLRVTGNPINYGIVLESSSNLKPPFVLFKATETDKNFIELNKNLLPDIMFEGYDLLDSELKNSSDNDLINFILNFDLTSKEKKKELIVLDSPKSKEAVNIILLIGLVLLILIFLAFIFFGHSTTSNLEFKSILSDNLVINSVMHKKLIKIDYTANLFTAISLMLTHNTNYLVVLKSSNIIGILTEKDILREFLGSKSLNYDINNIYIKDLMTKRIISVTPDTSVFEASHIMKQNHIHKILVRAGPAYTGILSIEDILPFWSKDLESNLIDTIKPFKELKLASRPIPEFQVSNWYDKRLIEIDSNTSILDSIKLLVYNNGCLVFKENNNIKGILTFGDIIRKVIFKSLDLNTSITNIINPNIYYIDRNTDLLSSIGLLNNSDTTHLIVRGKDEIKGTFSHKDVLTAFISMGKLYHKYH
jgi:CBS domain-containing membrane protein